MVCHFIFWFIIMQLFNLGTLLFFPRFERLRVGGRAPITTLLVEVSLLFFDSR